MPEIPLLSVLSATRSTLSSLPRRRRVGADKAGLLLGRALGGAVPPLPADARGQTGVKGQAVARSSANTGAAMMEASSGVPG